MRDDDDSYELMIERERLPTQPARY